MNIRTTLRSKYWKWLVAVLFLSLSADLVWAWDLQALGPIITASDEIKVAANPRVAEGEDLFKLINGGAVLFFQHQFKRALFQEYATKDGKYINLEIYQMGASANAKAIFQIKKGDQGRSVAFGEEAILADYYLLFRQGPYFVTITGEDATDPVRQALIHIARAVNNNMMIQPDAR